MARTSAGGDQNMVGRNGFAIDFNGMRINKTGKTGDDIDLIFPQNIVV